MTNDLVQNFYDVYHTHNLEHLRMILTSSYVGQVNGREIVGIEAAQAFLQAFLTAFPDVRYELHDRLDVGGKW